MRLSVEEGDLGRVLAAGSSETIWENRTPPHFCRPQTLQIITRALLPPCGHFDRNAEATVPLGCSKRLGRKIPRVRLSGQRSGLGRVTLPLPSFSLLAQASQHGNHQKTKAMGCGEPSSALESRYQKLNQCCLQHAVCPGKVQQPLRASTSSFIR